MTEQANQGDIQSWADRAMFQAEPHANYVEGKGVMPSVSVLNMTHRPLASVAAMARMYSGKVIRNLDDMGMEEINQAWEDSISTHLAAPLEEIKFQFIIDGVDRSFTHQMVRQRTANYAQESMRFAVIDDLPHNTTLAPSFHGEGQQQREMRELHDNLMAEIGRVYNVFIQNGVPAEDARSVLPHNTATRIIYDTNLRNLAEHAGNRLCTQAQFHWRLVWAQIIPAILEYGEKYDRENLWQYETMIESDIFRPACYRLGKCPFKASFDRACSIRERVDTHAASGVPSREWDNIRTEEWLMNPAAARQK
jgi:flavin-dependent thymidylate synthase